MEGINHAHIVSLMYKLITSAKESDDLSIGFDRVRNRRRNELSNNKNVKGKFQVIIMLKHVFGFAKYQEKATYDFGYKLTLTRNKDDAVFQKDVALADARTKIDHIHWYVPYYTPSIQQHGILSKQIFSKIPTQLRFVERSVFMEEVNDRNLWKFELGSQENMNVPIWINIGFQQRDRQVSQNLNNDTFCRVPVVSAQCIIGTEKHPDAGILINYGDDNYSQEYAQIKEAFRILTKDDIIQPNISDDDCRSSNAGVDEVGYNLYAFDIRYQQNFTASQPIKVEFNFD